MCVCSLCSRTPCRNRMLFIAFALLNALHVLIVDVAVALLHTAYAYPRTLFSIPLIYEYARAIGQWVPATGKPTHTFTSRRKIRKNPSLVSSRFNATIFTRISRRVLSRPCELHIHELSTAKNYGCEAFHLHSAGIIIIQRKSSNLGAAITSILNSCICVVLNARPAVGGCMLERACLAKQRGRWVARMRAKIKFPFVCCGARVWGERRGRECMAFDVTHFVVQHVDFRACHGHCRCATPQSTRRAYYFVNLSDVTLKTLPTCNFACHAHAGRRRKRKNPFLWSSEAKLAPVAGYGLGSPCSMRLCIIIFINSLAQVLDGRVCMCVVCVCRKETVHCIQEDIKRHMTGNWNECKRHTHNKSNFIFTAVTFYRPILQRKVDKSVGIMLA